MPAECHIVKWSEDASAMVHYHLSLPLLLLTFRLEQLENISCQLS
jgi:hypothetical protein